MGTPRLNKDERDKVCRLVNEYWDRYKRKKAAAGINVTQSTVNKECGWGEGNAMFNQILLNKRPLSPDQAAKLATIFGCDPWDLDHSLVYLKPRSAAPASVVANDDSYECVRSYVMRAAAGDGHDQVHDGEVEKTLAFQKAYLRSRHLKIENLRIGRVEGGSMRPRFDDGDTFIFDTSQRTLMSNRLFALHGEKGPRIKRFVKRKGMIDIESDNKELHRATGLPVYPTETVTPEVAESLIIGRVVWYCGDL